MTAEERAATVLAWMTTAISYEQIAARVDEAIRAAVREERQACAQRMEEAAEDCGCSHCCCMALLARQRAQESPA